MCITGPSRSLRTSTPDHTAVRCILSAGLLFATTVCGAAAEKPAFGSPLLVAAVPNHQVARTPFTDVVRLDKRWVAAGQRGTIAYSDDDGKSWRQATVPVSVDLNALSFPTSSQGWAVGHGSVILHSNNGGQNWDVQLDGRALGAMVLEHYRKKSPDANGASAAILGEAERMLKDGPERALLGIWFSDAMTGYAIGSFNLVLRTGDGGKTWQPLMERTENREMLHLYSIKKWGAGLFITGERGLLLRQDGNGNFKAIKTPYQGTFYGTVGNANAVVVFGLAGNAYRSQDAGLTWTKVQTGTTAILTGGSAAPDGSMLMTTADGKVLQSVDGGHSFADQTHLKGAGYSSVSHSTNGRVALTGMQGIQIVEKN